MLNHVRKKLVVIKNLNIANMSINSFTLVTIWTASNSQAVVLNRCRIVQVNI